MSTVEVFLTGDQIATFSSLSVKGKSNGTQVRIEGAQTLGDSTDVFRIVITDIIDGQTGLLSGQSVDVFAYPDTTAPPVPLFSTLNPPHDDFNGRASSADHQIFSDANLIFDANGFPDLPDFRYGPGFNPPRAEEMAFDTFYDTPPSVPCFVKGTLIETDTGPLPIEVLRAGDLVQTQDNGLQPIRWIGSREVPGDDRFAPVCITAGALGNLRDLWVSPQHRMVMDDWRAEVYFGETQVLLAAKHLVNGRTINQVPCARVTYYHMVFDTHEIVFAEGIATESLHLGDTALSSLDRAARAEVLALFPELAHQATTTARTCLRAWEGRLIA